jgi:hypothetical protein
MVVRFYRLPRRGRVDSPLTDFRSDLVDPALCLGAARRLISANVEPASGRTGPNGPMRLRTHN